MTKHKNKQNYDTIVTSLVDDYLLRTKDDLKCTKGKIVQSLIDRKLTGTEVFVGEQLKAEFDYNNKLVEYVIESLKNKFRNISLDKFKHKLLEIIEREYKKSVSTAYSQAAQANLAQPDRLKNFERMISKETKKAKQKIEIECTISEQQKSSTENGDDDKKFYQTSTFKFVVIPIICALIAAIPAWIAFVNDTGDATRVKTSSDSSPAIITTGPNSPVIVDYESSNLKKTQEELLKENKKQTILLERMQQIDETNHEKLIQTYPLGYVIFTIKDGDDIITQSTNRLQKEWRVDWNDAKVITINENYISIMHPGFYSKDGERTIAENIIGASRKKRNINPEYKGFGLELFFGILADDIDGIICLLGIKEQS